MHFIRMQKILENIVCALVLVFLSVDLPLYFSERALVIKHLLASCRKLFIKISFSHLLMVAIISSSLPQSGVWPFHFLLYVNLFMSLLSLQRVLEWKNTMVVLVVVKKLNQQNFNQSFSLVILKIKWGCSKVCGNVKCEGKCTHKNSENSPNFFPAQYEILYLFIIPDYTLQNRLFEKFMCIECDESEGLQ